MLSFILGYVLGVAASQPGPEVTQQDQVIAALVALVAGLLSYWLFVKVVRNFIRGL